MGFSKNPFLGLKLFLLSLFLVFFTLIAFICFGLKIDNENLNFSFREPENQELFLEQKILSFTESPELKIIQENSFQASSLPSSASFKVLGALGRVESNISREITEYIVQPGDNLSKIAENFGISLNTIFWANDLNKNSKILEGQKLIIPPVSGVIHLVQKGDTLSGLAKKYKTDLDKIIIFNELSQDGEIFIGDILVIPDGIKPAQVKYYSKEIPIADSYFIFPTTGTISQGLHWYNAIDVANKCGTPVYAAASGTVQRVKFQWPMGKFVRILHPNGVTTFYGHLSGFKVSPGEEVFRGQLIGYIGRTGSATGCHLHFDVRGARNPLANYKLGSIIKY